MLARDHDRGDLVWLTLAAAAYWIAAAPNQAMGQTDGPWKAMRSDAALWAVDFVDPLHGWAVGDRGAIWHTEDGGAAWRLQESGVDCALRGVHFLDGKTGWAVGGSSRPMLLGTTGVVLATYDGGKQWLRQDRQPLPALEQVRFFDSSRGIAIGARSPLAPSGVLHTEDGGRSWIPLPGASLDTWVAGDFLDQATASVVSSDGWVASVQRGEVSVPVALGIGLRRAHALVLGRNGPGWLVGDGGLVLTTADRGAHWHPCASEPPRELAPHFDWRAACVVGDNAWVAGSPGTRILRTNDAGRSWSVGDTGQSPPIYALTFVDDSHGWAVGALGTILATRDGGETWQRQRAGGTRAAVLGVYAASEDLPLELFAELCAAEGYLGVAVLLSRSVATGGTVTAEADRRAREALVAVGGSDLQIAWRLPVRERELRLSAQKVVDAWDRIHQRQGWIEAERCLVAQIRCWRPDVIFAPAASRRGDDSLDELINRLVFEAIKKAGDASQYGDQFSLARLEPWRVKKSYGAVPPNDSADVQLSTAQLAPRLGASLSDVAAIPYSVLPERSGDNTESLRFRLRHRAELGGGEQVRRLMGGITIAAGGEARRASAPADANNLEALRRLAEKRRNTQTILRHAATELATAVNLVAQLDELVAGMEPLAAAQVIWQLAEENHRRGSWHEAAETFALLAKRFPDHPLAARANAWLVQYWSSGEVSWREKREASSALEQALAIGEAIRRRDPVLIEEPSVGFVLASAQRRAGHLEQARRFYAFTSQTRLAADAWRTCVDGERWLIDSKGACPKPIWRVARAASRPYLDGKLDDAVWHAAEPAELHSPLRDDADWPAVVLAAYDEEFFYLAADCRRAAEAVYSAGGARTRDAEIDAEDRVELFLDIDRDYVTCYRLAVDHRGWAQEECWRDRSWNPNWYVSAGGRDDRWTFEAAIPLADLAPAVPTPGSAWAAGAQRIVPGVGMQSWSSPASARGEPQGFAYLIFE